MTLQLRNDSLPSFSIITPSFNQGTFLEYSLLSVLEQDYPRSKIQYIVMDGGSNDETVEILKRYNAEFAYWQSKPDGGQANAINTGMQRADGDIVAWLNSDDIYLPGVFREVAEVMKDNSIGATSSDAYHWDTNRRKLFLAKGLAPKLWLLRLYGNYIAQPSCFWRRSAWQTAHGLKGELQRFLDYDLQMRLLETGVVYKYLEKARAIILWHGENKCATLFPIEEWRGLAKEHKLAPIMLQRYVGKLLVTGMHITNGHQEWVYSALKQRIKSKGHQGLLGVEVSTEKVTERIGHIWQRRLSELTVENKKTIPGVLKY